jgi:hypothetical protein
MLHFSFFKHNIGHWDRQLGCPPKRIPLPEFTKKIFLAKIHRTEKDFWLYGHSIDTRRILPLIPANMPKRYLPMLPSPYSCFVSFKSTDDTNCHTAYLFVGRVQLTPSLEEQQT